MARINGKMSAMSAIIAMSDGNPGALAFLGLMFKSDPDAIHENLNRVYAKPFI